MLVVVFILSDFMDVYFILTVVFIFYFDCCF